MTTEPAWIFEFPARYELERIPAVPQRQHEPQIHLPGRAIPDKRRSTAVRVVPARGEPWTAIFHKGPNAAPPAAPDQLIGWPDERSVGFVGGGAAYIVRTDSRLVTDLFDGDWPVTDVAVSADHGLVVLADFISLVAFGAEGIVWETPRLVWDDLEIVAITRDALIAKGFNAPGGTTSYPEFQVDLRTGEARGAPYDERNWG